MTTKKTKAKQTSKAKAAISGEKSNTEIIYSLAAGSPIYVKTADLCRAFGKTSQWINELTKNGVICKTNTPHGSLYELFSSVNAYVGMLEDRAKRGDENVAEIELQRKRAEVRLKESKAAIEELKVNELRGKIHRSEDVQKMTADLLFYVRGGLRALAGRCASACAAASEPAEVQKIIEKEVFAIMDELSSYKYDAAKYDELVRQRMNREIDETTFETDDSEE
ncbi:MAG: hypothetical protein J1F04_01615 [Oscillospiraceae bacterium]|nr:hypothetical protein [Oscillospiraceae bacterium]